jgi:UDP-N-acetylglucosamine acyltransferase
MTVRIHPTAVVDKSAELGPDVVIEPYAIVGAGVRIGDGTTVAARATIVGQTRIGSGCQIGIGSVVGTDPQDRKFLGEHSTLEIGDETCLREYTTINRGTAATGATVIGRRCYFMSYAHVAHDCRIGDDVVLANTVQLGGHVTIDDSAQIGGATAIHQFVHIGTYAFVGGGSRVASDVPPYTLAAGNPLRLCGINGKGLRRAGFNPELRLALKRAYRLLFNSTTPRLEALATVRAEGGHLSEVRELLGFVERSERGVLV